MENQPVYFFTATILGWKPYIALRLDDLMDGRYQDAKDYTSKPITILIAQFKRKNSLYILVLLND